MKEAIKETIEVITTHPKTSIAVTGFFTSHVWLDYGLPAVQGITTIVGMLVVIAILIKHCIDLYNKAKGN